MVGEHWKNTKEKSKAKAELSFNRKYYIRQFIMASKHSEKLKGHTKGYRIAAFVQSARCPVVSQPNLAPLLRSRRRG